MAYFNLGSFGRPIKITSAEAQIWFDRGLVWQYGFNHEEAIACYERVLALEPSQVMARWGIAHCLGPNYNKLWEFFKPDERSAALKRAQPSGRGESPSGQRGGACFGRSAGRALSHRSRD